MSLHSCRSLTFLTSINKNKNKTGNVQQGNTDPNVATDYDVCDVLFLPERFIFVTAARRSILFWCGVTGRPQQTFRDLSSDDISAIATTASGDLLYIGTCGGDILCVDGHIGRVLRRWSHPCDYRLSVIRIVKTGLLVAVAEDGSLQVCIHSLL